MTFFPQAQDMDADQLLRQADHAMYEAKQAGKNRYHVFDAEQDSRQRPLCVGQQAMLAGAGGKTLREGEAALGRRELVLKRGPGAGRGDVNGNGGGGSGDQKTMHGALFRFRAGASGRQLRMH